MHEYFSAHPEVQRVVFALCQLSDANVHELNDEELIAVSCGEAIRYAYFMTQGIGMDRHQFVQSVLNIVATFDEPQSNHIN